MEPLTLMQRMEQMEYRMGELERWRASEVQKQLVGGASCQQCALCVNLRRLGSAQEKPEAPQ